MTGHIYKTTLTSHNTYKEGVNEEKEFYHMAGSFNEAHENAVMHFKTKPRYVGWSLWTEHFLQLSSFEDNSFVEK